MSTAPCWITREDVLGRDAALDLYDKTPCEHLHIEGDWDLAIDCVYQFIEAMCDLDKGHDGEHEFVSPDKIVLVFP